MGSFFSSNFSGCCCLGRSSPCYSYLESPLGLGCWLLAAIVSDAGICSTLCRWSDVSYIIKSLCSEHCRISASSFFLLLLLRVGSRYFSFTLARASFQQRILSLATRRLNVGCTRSTAYGHHHRHRRVHWLPCISR